MSLYSIILVISIIASKVSSQIDDQGKGAIKYGLKAANQDYAFQKQSKVLLAVPTANILHRTHSFLISIAAIEDSFDLLIVDELSQDGTVEYLQQHNIKYIQPDEPNGVTFNWNMAFAYFMTNNQYDVMFLSNNDVLIPNGVIDELAKSLRECNCDLISPLSSVHGKGHRPMDGFERVLNLHNYSNVVDLDINYQIVQNALDIYKTNTLFPYCSQNVEKMSFNGFFFGFNKRIRKIALDDWTLFVPKNRNIGQENDLTTRLRDQNMTICLNNVTFVYHYKASTITKKSNRQQFVRASQ